jgi:cytochrome c oxidase assembly factor CtaG
MAPLATAYSGPPKLTLAGAFTEWRVDVPSLVLILVVLAWYVASVRKVRRAGGQWGAGRSFAFIVLGLGFWTIATMAWPGVYESALFYARATQTVLLVLVAPLFLALGKPLTLLIEAYPRVGRPVEKAVRSRVAKVVTFPAITTLLLIVVPMSMYFTSWYTHVFDSGTVREFTYLILMAPGLAFFWTLLRVDPVPKEYPYGVAMWITAAEVVGDAFFGIAVIADQTMIGAAHYHAVGYPFGPSLATGRRRRRSTPSWTRATPRARRPAPPGPARRRTRRSPVPRPRAQPRPTLAPRLTMTTVPGGNPTPASPTASTAPSAGNRAFNTGGGCRTTSRSRSRGGRRSHGT